MNFGWAKFAHVLSTHARALGRSEAGCHPLPVLHPPPPQLRNDLGMALNFCETLILKLQTVILDQTHAVYGICFQTCEWLFMKINMEKGWVILKDMGTSYSYSVLNIS